MKGTFSPEFELEDTNIVTDDLNPYGRLSSGNLILHAKVFELPLREGKGGAISTNDEDNLFIGVTFHYRLLSERNEHLAALHLDWCMFGKELPEEDEIDQLCMILTSRGKPEVNLCHLDPVELMLGVLVLPTENEGEFVKVGLWYSEALGPGGRKPKYRVNI